MADFETIWPPRIGAEATAELRRYRKSGLLAPIGMCVFAGGAGVLFGQSTLSDVIAVTLVLATIGLLAVLLAGQRRFAAALGRWFGVKVTVKQIPIMSPKHFDRWQEQRGLNAPHVSAGHGSP
jgi:hypothetical protein